MLERLARRADLTASAPVPTPCCFIIASNCARFSGLMFFMRSLASGIFWPLTSRSMWTCHNPGLIGGGGGVVCACAARVAEAIASCYQGTEGERMHERFSLLE